MFINFVIGFVVMGVAFVWFWQKWGATPGKMLFGMRIVSVDSLEKPSMSMAIIRYVGAFFLGGMLFLTNIVVAFDKEQRQTLYDKVAKTRVIYSYAEDPNAKEIKFKRQTILFVGILVAYILFKLLQ